MNPLKIQVPELDSLAALLLERAGLKIGPDTYYALRMALNSRMPELGLTDAGAYIRRLKEPTGESELRALLPLVTVGKTDFFRDDRQFIALEQRILPDLLVSAKAESRPVSIWSAGCATGEEPYSLAMLFCELGAEPSQVNLLATDINEAAVAFAREGLYDKRRLGGVSSERLARHFSEAGERFAIRPSVKQLVGFDALNLASPLTGRVAPGTLDVILCRNVIIYFDFPTVHKVMDKFFDSLRPGGLLLLGYSESLFTVYDRFEMVEVEGAFIYRRPVAVAPKRGVDEPAPRPRTFVEPGVPAREASEAEYRARGGSPGARVPVKTPPFSLHRAKSAPAPTKRLTPLPRPKSPTGVALKKRLPTQRLAHAVARMTEGDFDETLRTLKALTADEPNDLDALITLGNVYTLLGQQDQARAAFAIALGREPLCLEARIFGGVSALQSGNLAEAVAELTRALFLEPTLAIGHYLLAQAQERGGSHDAARRSYRNALAQLKHAQRPLAGHYPDMLEAPDAIARAARYALAALEENR